ncbi:unnamed protein product [Lampetra fluviatilis]
MSQRSWGYYDAGSRRAPRGLCASSCERESRRESEADAAGATILGSTATTTNPTNGGFLAQHGDGARCDEALDSRSSRARLSGL